MSGMGIRSSSWKGVWREDGMWTSPAFRVGTGVSLFPDFRLATALAWTAPAGNALALACFIADAHGIGYRTRGNPNRLISALV